MRDNLDYGAQDGLFALDDYTSPRANTYPPYNLLPQSWPLSVDNLEEEMSFQRMFQHHPLQFNVLSAHQQSSTAPTAPTPLRTAGLEITYAHSMTGPAALLGPDWQFTYPQTPQQQTHVSEDALESTYDASFGQLQASPTHYLPATSTDMQLPISVSHATMPMAPFMTVAGPMDSLNALAGPMDSMNALAYPLNDYHTEMMSYPMTMTSNHAIDIVHSNPANNHSPTGSYLDVHSLPNSDNGWTAVDFPLPRQAIESYTDAVTHAVFNPSQTLHIRTSSDACSESSQSMLLGGPYEELPFPLYSPASESNAFELIQPATTSGGFALSSRFQRDSDHDHDHDQCGPQTPSSASASSVVTPPSANAGEFMIRTASAPSSSSSSTSPTGTLPPLRRRRSPTALSTTLSTKTTKAVFKKPAPTVARKDAAAAHKRIGRRRGPLRPDQRQQAHEIRKLRACLRCKFLKKTCDKGEPCAGCQPSHARTWVVPCTRIDIKDIGYFMKDWKTDYERHISKGFSINNIKGFATMERTLYVTHGFGHYLPVNAREVYVVDETCFGTDWTESRNNIQYAISSTAKLSAGRNGISSTLLAEYIDRHLDEGFDHFVDVYFEGTVFLTQILHTAYRYYLASETPVMRKALKLVVAYSLTMHLTLVEGFAVEESSVGLIDDESSKFFGKTAAPVMINFQVKCALADVWRDLQKDILEELSTLYSSVYQGDKLRHWPTIFMLATVLLAVWELMQFDSHFREPDEKKVDKFCTDMESTPVGVIIGLFQAISQKLPTFMEWDTHKHSKVLADNVAICDALTEVRKTVVEHEHYLRSRADAKYRRNDFDSLSNKFLARLVIRAN